jgi:hypothetical protein
MSCTEPPELGSKLQSAEGGESVATSGACDGAGIRSTGGSNGGGICEAFRDPQPQTVLKQRARARRTMSEHLVFIAVTVLFLMDIS